MAERAHGAQTISLNLDGCDESCEGRDRPTASGPRGGTFNGGGTNGAKGLCSVTGVLAGPGRITGFSGPR